MEDVLLKVGKVILPVDFVVLDMEEDPDVPLILGRPFLAIIGALIDLQSGDLTFHVNGKEMKFVSTVPHSLNMKGPLVMELKVLQSQ